MAHADGGIGELEAKLAHEREKFKSHDKEVKAAEKKYQTVEKEFQVRGAG